MAATLAKPVSTGHTAAFSMARACCTSPTRTTIASAALNLERLLRFLTHHLPQRLDMLALRRFHADGDANHPATLENRRSEIGRAGTIDPPNPGQRMLVQSFAF